MNKFAAVLLAIVAIVVGFYLFLRPSNNKTELEPDTNVPVAFQEGNVPSLIGYQFEFGNFAIKYPSTWNLVKGANNSDQAQIVTIESPVDINGFYYCIDFNEYNATWAKDVNFTAENVAVLAVNDLSSADIGKPLKLVFYQDPSTGRLFSTVTDDLTVTADSGQVAQSITNPFGRMVQILGRFDCREDQPPQIGLDVYENSQLYHDAHQVMLNMAF